MARSRIRVFGREGARVTDKRPGPGFNPPPQSIAAQVARAEAAKEVEPVIPGRPDWNAWGLDVAQAIAARADCTRRKVGAVIVRPDHRIVSTGYNGAPSGSRSCLKGHCPRGKLTVEQIKPLVTSYDTGPGSCIALHAEQNALLRCDWDQMQDATMYVTCEPCPGCMRMILGTHLMRVVWPQGSARIFNGTWSVE